MNAQDNIQQTSMSTAHPNSQQNAPYDPSQPMMPNGGVPPGYPPPQQTPYYQGQGVPPYPHYPNPYPHYPTPPPATQMQPTPGMAPQWQQPPQGPAPQPNASAPMHQANYTPPPPPSPYGPQAGYPPHQAYPQHYGWPQQPMPGYYYQPHPPAPMPGPQYPPQPYAPPPTGAAPGHGYAPPSTLSSYGTSGTLPRDSTEQDSVLQSENSLPQQTQNMSLNVQATQTPDLTYYQQTYQNPDPRFNQQPYQTPDPRLNQQPQFPDPGFNQQPPQNLDMTLNQQQLQTPDPRLSQQTISTPDPTQSEQLTQVSDPGSSPVLTNPRVEEGSTVQLTEAPMSGISIAPEGHQRTSFTSHPVDPSMTQETQRSNTPLSDSEDELALNNFIARVEEKLENLTEDQGIEMVRRALLKLGLEKCIDALEEEFGMNTLFNAANGRNI